MELKKLEIELADLCGLELRHDGYYYVFSHSDSAKPVYLRPDLIDRYESIPTLYDGYHPYSEIDYWRPLSDLNQLSKCYPSTRRMDMAELDRAFSGCLARILNLDIRSHPDSCAVLATAIMNHTEEFAQAILEVSKLIGPHSEFVSDPIQVGQKRR